MKELDLLKAIFVAFLEGREVTRVGLLRALDVPERELAKALGSLKKESLVEIGGRGVRLTPKGRRKLRVVFIGGTFEVIHAGHLYTIQQANRLGDVLVVVVARDTTVRKRKNREPLAPEEARGKEVGGIRQVNAAIVGSERTIYETPDMDL